jgi:hypothetical protein
MVAQIWLYFYLNDIGTTREIQEEIMIGESKGSDSNIV